MLTLLQTNDGWEGIVGRMKVNSIELIIRTQLLTCKCYSNDMAKYQYPAYKMLLSCVRLPLSTVHGQEYMKYLPAKTKEISIFKIRC